MKHLVSQLGYLRSYAVITENLGAHQAVEILSGYAKVKILKAINILKEAIVRGFIKIVGDVEKVFREYEKETKIFFQEKS